MRIVNIFDRNTSHRTVHEMHGLAARIAATPPGEPYFAMRGASWVVIDREIMSLKLFEGGFPCATGPKPSGKAKFEQAWRAGSSWRARGIFELCRRGPEAMKMQRYSEIASSEFLPQSNRLALAPG
jgi:hypothetical protein